MKQPQFYKKKGFLQETMTLRKVELAEVVHDKERIGLENNIVWSCEKYFRSMVNEDFTHTILY